MVLIPNQPTEALFADEEDPARLWEPENDVIGFNVPLGLGFLTPVLDAIHMKVLSAKQKLDNTTVQEILRILPTDQQEDYVDDILYLDDEELEVLYRHRIRQDIQRNEQYAKAFGLLVTSPIPYIVARAWVNFPDPVEILSLISVIISASCVPEVYTDRLAIVIPSHRKLKLIRANMYLSLALAGFIMLFPARVNLGIFCHSQYYWTNDGDVFGVFPLVMAIASHAIRRMMEAVNQLEMNHVRYMYRTPALWEQIGMKAAMEQEGL